MVRTRLFQVMVFITAANYVYNQENNPCTSKITCGKCIEAHERCSWCSDNDKTIRENDIAHRCDLSKNLKLCTNISNPQHSEQFITNDKLSDKGVKGDPIQLKPQHVNIQLRPNSVYKLDVQFRQADDYPLDLYYLMDLSWSMWDDKDNLAGLGSKLAKTMANLTSKFRIGFGSFVDKKVMPYVNTVPAKLLNPCNDPKIKCDPPYGFINQMPLNQNAQLFTTKVKDTPISGNLDTPEGGFDALAQVIACKNEIGWQEKSRKIIVLSTDSLFHQAGDGLLGGIIKPNDMECHLDYKGEYTESLTQDYPSISQLNGKIKEQKMNVIFAVSKDALPLYSELTSLLEGSSSGELSANSNNVVELVEDQYKKITSSVELRHNANNELLSVVFHSKCLDGRDLERSNCSGLRVGQTVDFSVEIKAIGCTKENRKQTIQIHPVGINEVLSIDIDMMCECDCEKEDQEERASSKCSGGNGTYECGICTCNEKRFGRQCECGLTDSAQSGNQAICTKPGDTLTCSGRGSCLCRRCECEPRDNPDEKVFGEYCECDNFSCERNEGVLCNGKGQCQCGGKCECDRGWTRSKCDCRDTNSTCLGPDMKLCSDHGVCECGRCICTNSEKQRYSGTYCEECPICPRQCDLFKDCVQCLLFESGKYSKEDCTVDKKCGHFQLNKVDEISDLEVNGKVCFQIDDSTGCKFTFKYNYGEGKEKPVVTAEIGQECPLQTNVLHIVSGVAGGVVAIGILLITLWKIYAMIHDKKEYARFEEERQKAQWNQGENPLYKPSTTVFKNPTFDSN